MATTLQTWNKLKCLFHDQELVLYKCFQDNFRCDHGVSNFAHYGIIIEEGKISGNNGIIGNLNTQHPSSGSRFMVWDVLQRLYESELIRCRYDWNVRYWPLLRCSDYMTILLCCIRFVYPGTMVQSKDKAKQQFLYHRGLISEYHWWINWCYWLVHCPSRSSMMDLDDQLDSELDKNMHSYWLFWWEGGVITLFHTETKMKCWLGK